MLPLKERLDEGGEMRRGKENAFGDRDWISFSSVLSEGNTLSFFFGGFSGNSQLSEMTHKAFIITSEMRLVITDSFISYLTSLSLMSPELTDDGCEGEECNSLMGTVLFLQALCPA